MTYEPVYTRPRNAFVPSPIFVGIVAIFAVAGFMAWTGFGNAGVDVFLFVVSGWLVSLCLHEYGHAVAGYFSGDRSVADRGYLRLNPLKYTNPLLSIVLPIVIVIIGGIGLPGGAVWIDHRHINSRAKDSLISVTGPLANIVLALVASVPFLLGFADNGLSDPHYAFWSALALLAFLQVTAAILNLLPIPGLDGGGIIYPWLSREYQRAWNLFAPYGFMVLFLLLWQVPQINEHFYDFVFFFTDRLDLDRQLISEGLSLMRFWSHT